MKIKLSVLLCILAMLMTGCGGAAAAPETTAAPTEPPTFFEEQGFQEWEGFTVEADPEVREIHGTATIPNAAELFFYKKEGDTATEILHKEIIEADVDVHIAAYNFDEFGMEGISDVVDSFYQKAVEDGETMAKEEWLTAHENYVVYNCWMIDKANCAKHVDEYLADKDASGWYSWMRGLFAMDCITGNVYYPHEDTSGIVGRFPLTENKENTELLVVYEESIFTSNSETSDHTDWGSVTDMYVMVPKSHDGLTFVYEGYLDYHGTDEEIIADTNGEENEETSKWEQLPYQDYREEYDYVTPYFFTPAALDEQDTRPAPVVGTFFDKMGIEANMEKFEVAESVSDSGVKEIHWNNKISIPGAEVLYFNAEKKSAKSYVDKKLANCILDVYAREYTADQFTSQDIQDIINSFYEADDTDMPKSQWLQEHQDHKLIHFSSKVDFWVSHATNQFFANHTGYHWYWAYTNWPKLIDKHTGEIFMPQSGSDGVVEEFEVSDVKFAVMNTQDSEWYDPVARYNNYRKIYNMYVLLPADYDGLIYSLELYKENRSDEDILALFDDNGSTESAEDTTETEEETSTWWSGDFYEEDPYSKRYYFIPAN